MGLIGNILWIVFGGFFSFLLYMGGAALLCLTVIGIPFGIQTFRIGLATLAPFGRQTEELPDANNITRLILNALWILTFGWGIALNHLFWAAVLGVTIIGIPFAIQHLKLIPFALLPFGRRFIPQS